MAKVDPFGLPPAEAVEWFRKKGYAISFDWRDVYRREHAKYFTVAKATQLDLLADIRHAVDRAIASGQTLQQFRKELRPKLEEYGWWGKQEMVDPKTGEKKLVQLGSPRRLRTIYETNLRTAMAAGRWERIKRTSEARPYLRYVAVMDGRERPEHRAWHGTVLRYDDPWWSKHYPPNGWGCRCEVQQLSERDLERYGYKVSERPKDQYAWWHNERTGQNMYLPKGIDPGFDYHVGKAPRGYDPDAEKHLTPLKDIPNWQRYGRPSGDKIKDGRDASPPLWPSVEGPSDVARTRERFRELFGTKPGEPGAVRDPLGMEVTFREENIDHVLKDLLRARAKGQKAKRKDKERASFFPAAKATVEQPYEVWLVPHRHGKDHPNAGNVVMRMRYIGIFEDGNTVVVVDRDGAGNAVVTHFPRRDIDSKREGYLLYPR